MPENVANFRAAQAAAAGDNTLWTARDAAEDFIADIDAGRINPARCVIIYQTELENGHWVQEMIRANISIAEETHMLSTALFFHHQRSMGSVSD